MKTVFITIFHGHIARNILLTDILGRLKAELELRVIMLCPEVKREYYQEHFSGGNIEFVGLPVLKPTTLDRWFRAIYYYFVDTETVRLRDGEQYLLGRKYGRYALSRLLTKILGRLRWLRQAIRWLDKTLITAPKEFQEPFDHYRPGLVFISSITSDQDAMMLREAKRRKISSLAMVRSWDNFSVNKGNARVYPDKLLVHNRFLADDAIRLADFPPESIMLVGMPHFDFYINEPRLLRAEAARLIGADPVKKWLFFLMIGLSSGQLDAYVTGLLEGFIANDSRFKDFQLIVRPHPNTGKLVEGVGSRTIVNYPRIVEFPGRLTDREFTKEDMDLYASLIAHSAVVVSYQGTGTIDSAALDRPVINVAFEENDKVPYLAGIVHQYDYTHYRPIIATDGVKIVRGPEELRQAILDYSQHPERDKKGRERLVAENCYKLDGRASERVVAEIKKALKIK